MLAGCLLPLLLIFALPLFGVDEGVSIWLFMILMFACHLFMMRGHHEGGAERGGKDHH
jgi:hypothetical protein